MTCHNLLSLPNDLLAALVTDWLTWKEVGRLDSAVCSTVQRQDWLQLLAKDCVFRSVSIRHFWNRPETYSFGWFVSRQIRTNGLNCNCSDGLKSFEGGIPSKWLRNTAPFITSVWNNRLHSQQVSSILQTCTNLMFLSIEYCRIDDAGWEVIRGHPKLEELYVLIDGFIPQAIPPNTNFHNIRRLKFDLFVTCDNFYVSLISQLPALVSLKLTYYHAPGFYDKLFGTCSKLVHLDLRHIDHDHEHNAPFYNLLKSLKTGLRCLVLPNIHNFTNHELHAIEKYHGHSLRCLSIADPYYRPYNRRDYQLADLIMINNLPILHTLKVVYANFGRADQITIVNPTIKHLLLDFYTMSTDGLLHLSEQFPAVSKLTLTRLDGPKAVQNILRFVESRPLITTVCVDDDKVREELRIALRGKLVGKSEEIDIFTQAY